LENKTVMETVVDTSFLEIPKDGEGARRFPAFALFFCGYLFLNFVTFSLFTKAFIASF
jgi:hypothetical protein